MSKQGSGLECITADSHNVGWVPYIPDLWITTVGTFPEDEIWKLNLTYLFKLAQNRSPEWYLFWQSNRSALVFRSLGTFVAQSERAVAIKEEADLLKTLSSFLPWLKLFSRHKFDYQQVEQSAEKFMVLFIEGADFLLDLSDPWQWLRKNCISIVQPLYSHTCRLGSGCYSATDTGLTTEGKQFIKASAQEGFLIDVSHASPMSVAAILDAIESDVIVSHGTSYEVDQSSRGWPEETLQLLRTRCKYFGQMIGPNPLPTTRLDFPSCVKRRLDYVLDVLGQDKVGIASDWQWGWHCDDVLGKLDKWEAGEGVRFISNWQECGSFVGDYTQRELLLSLGYPSEVLCDVAGKNLLRMVDSIAYQHG